MYVVSCFPQHHPLVHTEEYIEQMHCLVDLHVRVFAEARAISGRPATSTTDEHLCRRSKTWVAGSGGHDLVGLVLVYGCVLLL